MSLEVEGQAVGLPVAVLRGGLEAGVGHRRFHAPLPFGWSVALDEAGEHAPNGVVGLGAGGAELRALALPV